MRLKFRLIAGFACALALAASLRAGGAFAEEAAGGGPVIVFAAASLKNALDDASAAWQKESGREVRISYAASSALAKQLEQDAPAQIFISADEDWMNYVAGKGLIKPESRAGLLGNKLVLIAPKDSAVSLELEPGADLAAALGAGRLAMGNVDSVPAGKYGKAALEKLGSWAGVSGKLAQAESVRAALLLGLARRGGAGRGLPDRRGFRSQCEDRGNLPRRVPSAHRLSRGTHHKGGAGGGGLPRLHQVLESHALFQGARLHRAGGEMMLLEAPSPWNGAGAGLENHIPIRTARGLPLILSFSRKGRRDATNCPLR